MNRSRILIVLGLLGVSLLLVLQQTRISDLQKENAIATATAFRQQLNPGFACGLLTQVEAANFLQQTDVLGSGTIIPADSPTADTRVGSPRLDSCSYTQLSNNLSYIDVIVKTYENNDIANQAYTKDMQSVMYAEPGNLGTATTTDTYSSGVHYILRGRYVLEIGASKTSATIGAQLEAFSDSVATFILQKL